MPDKIFPRCYIAGPISGRPEKEYRDHFEMAERAVRDLAYMPVSPVKVCSDIPPGSEWVVYMEKCLVNLVSCHAVYLLNGWEESNGARIEKAVAETMGLNLYYEVEK